MNRANEAAFETVIEAHLLQHGYERVPADAFDRERAIFPPTVLAFIRDTQPTEWAKLELLHGDKTGEQILTDLCRWMDVNGSLATLRHGFKCYGRTLRVAYFKAAHELNPELEARYSANRLGLTRQLHFSPRSEKSLDVTLSLNGIPVLTLELKNPLTGQTVEDACRQYKQDRDPWEPIFEFKPGDDQRRDLGGSGETGVEVHPGCAHEDFDGSQGGGGARWPLCGSASQKRRPGRSLAAEGDRSLGRGCAPVCGVRERGSSHEGPPRSRSRGGLAARCVGQGRQVAGGQQRVSQIPARGRQTVRR